ncbi:MAG: hypothetical protein GY862_27180 [Gammaproteobacteria bacterium]|nr:hypothetical protein [Gammaproteobacteria bacterium]MCP5013883.1 hypothetical protein [Ketobacter sp.]
MKDHGLASVALHVFLLILRDKYSDAEIKRILSRRNVNGALEIINELERAE